MDINFYKIVSFFSQNGVIGEISLLLFDKKSFFD